MTYSSSLRLALAVVLAASLAGAGLAAAPGAPQAQRKAAAAQKIDIFPHVGATSE